MLLGDALLILNVTVSKVLSSFVSYGSEMGLINLTHVLDVVFHWGVFFVSNLLRGSHLGVELVFGISDRLHDLFVLVFLGTENIIAFDVITTLKEGFLGVLTMFLGRFLILWFFRKACLGLNFLLSWLIFFITLTLRFTFTVTVVMVVLLVMLLFVFLGMSFVGFSLFLRFNLSFLLN